MELKAIVSPNVRKKKYATPMLTNTSIKDTKKPIFHGEVSTGGLFRFTPNSLVQMACGYREYTAGVPSGPIRKDHASGRAGTGLREDG
jgi:hypothetical protein